MPSDPVMLLSYVNTQLRDHFSSLDDLCKSFSVSKREIMEKLAGINYEYDPAQNRFL